MGPILGCHQRSSKCMVNVRDFPPKYFIILHCLGWQYGWWKKSGHSPVDVGGLSHINSMMTPVVEMVYSQDAEVQETVRFDWKG